MPRGPKSYNWCFTLNNYTEEDIKDISGWKVKGVAYAKETGENGTPHLQGYVCCNSQLSLVGMKKLNDRCHWEIMKGNLTQNETYCSKQGQLTIIGTNTWP